MKQRYFLRLSYKGTNFSGWQRQLNAHTVQEEIEDAFKLLFKRQIHIIGCGRTDSGVHAINYIAHFDLEEPLDFDLVFKLNHIVSQDITIHEVFPVDIKRHARFNAIKRTYTYKLKGGKDSFFSDFAYRYPMIHQLDVDKLNEAAKLLMEYKDFFTFCKAKTDVKTTVCDLTICEWRWIAEDELEFKISANRFLRGMVRLIVGMCINVALGKITLDSVKTALENKKRLERDWSVLAQGLTLHDIEYPYDSSAKESIIKIRVGSIDEVVKLTQSIPEFIDPYSAEIYTKRLENTPHVILVAEKQGKIIAAKVGYERQKDDSFYSWMGAVSKPFRGLGIATRLANRQEQWAIDYGYTNIQMKTRFKLKGMQKFNIDRGYHICKIEHREPREESVIWMQKELVQSKS